MERFLEDLYNWIVWEIYYLYSFHIMVLFISLLLSFVIQNISRSQPMFSVPVLYSGLFKLFGTAVTSCNFIRSRFLVFYTDLILFEVVGARFPLSYNLIILNYQIRFHPWKVLLGFLILKFSWFSEIVLFLSLLSGIVIAILSVILSLSTTGRSGPH